MGKGKGTGMISVGVGMSKNKLFKNSHCYQIYNIRVGLLNF